MPSRTKYVPVFSSQLSYSQSGASQPEQTPEPSASSTQSRRYGRRTKRGNIGLLKVQLPKFRKGKNKLEKASGKWRTEPVADTSGYEEEPAPPTGAGPESGSPGEMLNDKEKAKLAVLKTISRLLQENQLIRQRLVELNKTK